MTHSANNYGPYQLPDQLIPLMICHAMDNKPRPVYGTGENDSETDALGIARGIDK